MPATDQCVSVDEDERTQSLDPYAYGGAGDDRFAPGNDPGEPDTWEIVRVACPECRRPVSLIGDEERLPQHAVPPTAWHPFAASVCPGSGVPTDDLEVCDTPADATGPGLAALLTLPAGLDWRTQPFSHPARPGSSPLAEIPRQQRRLVRR